MAPIFTESFLQEVMDKSDIIDHISRHVALKRSGGTLKGLCPFHKEKTPSFTVSADKQLYYCFGCGNGGTVINFVMQMENLDFVEAVKYLAEQAGLAVPETGGYADSENAKTRQLIYQINTVSARFFHDCLSTPQGGEAQQYIIKRGLTQGAVTKFGIGFAPEGNRLLAHLKAQGFTENQIIESGMAVKNDSGNVYDRFRNRLMFPIIDVRKNVIGFGGRVLGDGIPKYLNSPETAAFNKSYNLFGLNFAKSTKESYLILVEGYLDVISLHQNGVTSAVATLGTALTPEQARIIRRNKPEVVIAYDSDEAGQKATKRAIELLAEEGVTVRVLTMSGCKDPDEYIKTKGAGAFLQLIADAKVQIEYKITKLQEQYHLDNIEDKIKYIHALAEEFAKIKSPVEREIYVNKIAAETGVSPGGIFGEIERITAAERRKQRLDEFRGSPSVGGIGSANPKAENITRAQRLLLNLMSGDAAVSQAAGQALDASDFDEGINRRLFELLLSVRANGAEPDIRLIVSQLGDSAQVAKILHEDNSIEDKLLAANEMIRLLSAERKRRRLLEMAESADIPSERKLGEMNKIFGKGGRDQ